MNISFHKYQGTGNDFVIIDNRNGQYDNITRDQVAFLCHRRFGIGADGLMLLQKQEGVDFFMKYFNADGRESSMCGNGGRCLSAFAHELGVVGAKAIFNAIDGKHNAMIGSENGKIEVKLQMTDVEKVEVHQDFVFLNTGSPHYVTFVENLDEIDVYNEGRSIRYSANYQPGGTNVNFVEVKEEGLHVRTYERGVEDETYSCGTGVTAAVIAAYAKGLINTTVSKVFTKGGLLNVYFEDIEGKYKNVWLEGPGTFVYKGEIDVK